MEGREKIAGFIEHVSIGVDGVIVAKGTEDRSSQKNSCESLAVIFTDYVENDRWRSFSVGRIERVSRQLYLYNNMLNKVVSIRVTIMSYQIFLAAINSQGRTLVDK